MKDEKILICIDNIETLLMDNHREFSVFNQSLPLNWRLLVTSRIPIDSATTVSLEALNKRHAVGLSRNYLKKRGVIDYKEEDLEKIAGAANNNPLAIRLTIDLYIRGNDIAESMAISQKEIAAFSYRNLIEALKQNSITILEAIYAIGSPTKIDLVDFIDLTNDEIIESINELSKTSLIIRSSDEFGNDVFRLSESIRDLLLVNPKNIEARHRIADLNKRRKTKILEQSARIKQLNISEFDDEFIPEGVEPYTYSLIADLNKCLAKNGQSKDYKLLISLREKFADTIRYKNNDSLLYFHYSRIFRELKDVSAELSFLLKAEKLNEDSHRIKFAIARRFFYNSDYQDALTYLKILKNKKISNSNNSTLKFNSSVTKLFHLCLLYLSQYDEIIAITVEWANDEFSKIILGVSRATALKRKMEYQFNAIKPEMILENEATIKQILSIFNEIFISGNYNESACNEAKKVINELSFLVFENNDYSSETKYLYLQFVAKHFFNVVSKLKYESINSDESQFFLERIYKLQIPNNPLHKVKWYIGKEEGTFYDKEHIEELKAKGYEIVTVYHIPDKYEGMSKFMFAKDAKNNEYYLQVNNFESGWLAWGYIREKSKLAIKHRGIIDKNKPTPATEIVEIDHY